jgi:hypothetical protein
MVGKLIHLTHTRPNISFAVGMVSRYMAGPHVSHLLAMKQILRYSKEQQIMEYFTRPIHLIYSGDI